MDDTKEIPEKIGWREKAAAVSRGCE